MQVFDMLEPSGQPAAFAEQRSATGDYINKRVELLELVWRSYLDSDGESFDREAVKSLDDIDVEFRLRAKALAGTAPFLANIPDMIATTAYPLPFFVESDAVDDAQYPEL